MQRSRKRYAQVEEDITSQAGWLFADSFLALMVIFLATISFVPSLGGNVSNNTNIGNIGGKNFVKGLNLVYSNFDAAQITTDVATFEKSEGLPTASKVIYASIVGGFDPKNEDSDAGRLRAVIFAAKLQKASLENFADVKIALGASNGIKPDTVVLRLTISG